MQLLDFVRESMRFAISSKGSLVVATRHISTEGPSIYEDWEGNLYRIVSQHSSYQLLQANWQRNGYRKWQYEQRWLGGPQGWSILEKVER